jgi:hypothetical protein
MRCVFLRQGPSVAQPIRVAILKLKPVEIYPAETQRRGECLQALEAAARAISNPWFGTKSPAFDPVFFSTTLRLCGKL